MKYGLFEKEALGHITPMELNFLADVRLRCALCTPAEHASLYPRLGYDIIYGPCDNILRS